MGITFRRQFLDAIDGDSFDEIREGLDDLERCDFDGCDEPAQIEYVTLEAGPTGDIYCSDEHRRDDKGHRF